MIYTADFIEMAGKINYLEVVKYLKDLGWSEVESKRPNVKVFQLVEESNLFQATIPMSRELNDYNFAIFQAVEQIAKSSNKSTEHVLLELLNPLSDIIRFQVKEPSSESGTIQVEDAIKLYDNAKKLVTFASMDSLHPSQYHLGRPDAVSQELVQKCRFGQTEIGSYIVSLVLPFTKLNEGKLVQMTLFNEEVDKSNSPTRMVTKKIITSIQQIKDAIGNDTFFKMMWPEDPDKNPPPISANFLEALSSIGIYKSNSEVNISVKWAPTIKNNRTEIDSVSLTSDYFAPISSLVHLIKGKRADEREFVGRISSLQALPNVIKRKEGEIKLDYLDPDTNRANTAKVLLNKEDYHIAIEAHDRGKWVKITGCLSGQKWKTIDYSNFEVLE